MFLSPEHRWSALRGKPHATHQQHERCVGKKSAAFSTSHRSRREQALATITVEPSGEVIYLGSGETVLGGLYKAGYSYTVGCRRGGCGICKVNLVSGAVEYPTTVADTVLTPDERLEGTCLSCRAVPTGDVTIALRGEELRLINPLLRSINDRARQRAEAAAAAGQTATSTVASTVNNTITSSTVSSSTTSTIISVTSNATTEIKPSVTSTTAKE